jgi:hypothetical protein
MTGRMVSGSARPGKSTRPDIPAKTAPTSKQMMQMTAMKLPPTISFWLRAAMKRVRS